MITDIEFQAIGFDLIKVENNTVRFYRFNQYTLTYDTITQKVCVVYGTVSRTYDTVYVSIVVSFEDLTSNLIKNNVIDSATVHPNLIC